MARKKRSVFVFLIVFTLFCSVGIFASTSFAEDEIDANHSTYNFDSGAIETLAVDEVSAPRRPNGLRIEAASSDSITLTWNPVNDAVHYEVYRSRFHPHHIPNADETFEKIGGTDQQSFTDEHIHSSNPYYYVVKAVNGGGMSEASRVLDSSATNRSNNGKVGLNSCGNGPFDAQVSRVGDTWQAINNGVVYSGDDMLAAMQAAVDSLTPNRTSQEKVVVHGSGTISDTLDLPSHTSLEVCGTIHAEELPAPAINISYEEDVSIPYLQMTGNPWYGIYVRTSENLHFGQIDLRFNGGMGIRIDSRDDDSVYGVRDVRIDDVYVSGTSNHGVETYGVDGIDIGTVTAVDVGYSGLMLNDTINATVDAVYGYNVASGTGYATFRMANRNGHIDDQYSTNIHVGEVVAHGGGRGMFCVSQSGGAVIERVDITNSGSNAILIENCYNVEIQGGVVDGPGDIRIAARTEFPNTSDVLIENITLRNSAILESPCGENIEFRNITLENSTMNTCG